VSAREFLGKTGFHDQPSLSWVVGNTTKPPARNQVTGREKQVDQGKTVALLDCGRGEK